MIGVFCQFCLMPDTPRYRVLHSLGKGGMSEVFLADDTQLGRQVAIKFLADGATNDSRALWKGSTVKPARRLRWTTPSSARFTRSLRSMGEPAS